MVLSIHQPNFFPYAGFFEKMKQSDMFVILTNVQYTRSNYQNRFDYHGWRTMSVNSGIEPIRNKRYINFEKDWDSIRKMNPKLKQFDAFITENLVDTNVAVICHAMMVLGIETELHIDYPTELTGSERLLDICKKKGATTYLSGISGKKYLDVKLFEDNGIDVIFQENPDKRSLIEIL